MTAQRGFQPATQRGTVNRSNRRFPERIQLRQYFPQRRVLRWFAKFADIGARNKCTARTVKNHRVDGVVPAGFSKAIADALAYGVGQSIDRWVVDRDDRDLAVPGQSDWFAHPV